MKFTAVLLFTLIAHLVNAAPTSKRVVEEVNNDSILATDGADFWFKREPEELVV